MKKILFFLSAAALLTACQGEPGRDGIDGKDGKDGAGITWHIIDVKIASQEWQYSNKTDNNYYYAEVSMPEIDQEMYNNGMVQAYVENTYSDGTITQGLLPNVRHYEYTSYQIKSDTLWQGGRSYVSSDTTYYQGLYTQTIDYEYTIGSMTFYITNSDFYYNPADLAEPGDKHFRVVLQY